MKSNFNIQFSTQRLREEEIEETSATPGEGAYLTKAGAKRQTPKATSGYKEVKGYRPGHSKLKIVEPKDLWNLNEAVATKDKENIKSILQLVKGDSELYDTFIGMMSEPYPHGYDEFYNMLPTDKQLQAPKPEELSQSDSTWSQKIKSFFGKRPQQEDLADSNEPPKVINYPNGEKVEVGQKIKINNKQIKDGYGVVTGFDNQTILVRVDRDSQSSQPRQDIPVDISDIEQMEDTINEAIGSRKDEILTLIQKLSVQGKLNQSSQEVLIQWMNDPHSSEDAIINYLTHLSGGKSLKEGIRTEIKQRNKSQQFHEATKMVNKKLKEINNILEYAEQLKGELDESARPNHLMEKMKRGMVSAYNKMRKL